MRYEKQSMKKLRQKCNQDEVQISIKFDFKEYEELLIPRFGDKKIHYFEIVKVGLKLTGRRDHQIILNLLVYKQIDQSFCDESVYQRACRALLKLSFIIIQRMQYRVQLQQINQNTNVIPISIMQPLKSLSKYFKKDKCTQMQRSCTSLSPKQNITRKNSNQVENQLLNIVNSNENRSVPKKEHKWTCPSKSTKGQKFLNSDEQFELGGLEIQISGIESANDFLRIRIRKDLCH
ncbi:unnamed protein product [Paramecium octaurelia]|uniref:Uncharacterized protein n=1 Tax=Paramecium octaurelia TaxID=43137 RepID=A0A8S1SJB9_PAROT|nr:unnamed protein product [Paramecium octaurelia]